MLVTAELSLYPLKDEFEGSILKFIQFIKSYDSIEVYTHSMSTYIKGEQADVFKAISEALESIGSEQDTLSLVLKLINRNLPVEKGFLNFEK